MLGIGQEGWLQLWSGFIGSVVGAVAAALVALLVVWRTNKHQTSLAVEAARKQADLIEKQLAEQRKGLEDQLQQQQEELNRQLHEQRMEARRERERSAMAVIVSGLTVLRAQARHAEFDPRPDLALVAGGIHRWRLELGPTPLSEELQLWPGLLWQVQNYVKTCREHHERFTPLAERMYIADLDFLLQVCMRWSQSESDEYGALMNDMADHRLAIDERIDRVENRR